jgi:hypothetical protein
MSLEHKDQAADKLPILQSDKDEEENDDLREEDAPDQTDMAIETDLRNLRDEDAASSRSYDENEDEVDASFGSSTFRSSPSSYETSAVESEEEDGNSHTPEDEENTDRLSSAPLSPEEDQMFVYLKENGYTPKDLAKFFKRTSAVIFRHNKQIRPALSRQNERRRLQKLIRSVTPQKTPIDFYAEGKPHSEALRQWAKLPRRDKTPYLFKSIIDRKRYMKELREIGITPEKLRRYHQLEFPPELVFQGKTLSGSVLEPRKRQKKLCETFENFLKSGIMQEELRLREYQAQVMEIPIWLNLREKATITGENRKKIERKGSYQIEGEKNCDFFS